MENNSKEFRLADIQKLIRKKRKKENWAITFMGTTEEALKEASSWGIARSNMMKYSDSAEGVTHASDSRRNALVMYSDSVQSATYGADIKEEGLMEDEEVKEY